MQPSATQSENERHSDSALELLAASDVAASVIPMPRIGAAPPTEFRAFKWGENPTTKGPIKLTPKGVSKAMDTFRSRGVVLCFDYFHATYDPEAKGEAKKAAGQCRLEVRDDGVYYTSIQWTPKAAQAISDGEWPFVSPSVLIDKKTREIFEFRNPGLVTDPGLIAAVPTILADASATPKGNPMDKKRMTLDAYASCETAMKRLQAMADTDGAEKDLGNAGVGKMAAIMDMMKSHMGAGGYAEEAPAATKGEEAKEAMMAALASELGESDPAKLHLLILAKMDAKAPPAPAPAPAIKGVLLSDADAAAVTKLMLDGHAAKVPAARRAVLEKQGPSAVAVYLSSATEITPSVEVREAAPLAPTTANLAAAIEEKPMPTMPGAAASKPTSLAACTPQQRIQVEAHLDSARRFNPDGFNEATELQYALESLSADAPPAGNNIRHLPYGVDSSTGKVTTLSGEV